MLFRAASERVHFATEIRSDNRFRSFASQNRLYCALYLPSLTASMSYSFCNSVFTVSSCALSTACRSPKSLVFCRRIFRSMARCFCERSYAFRFSSASKPTYGLWFGSPGPNECRQFQPHKPIPVPYPVDCTKSGYSVLFPVRLYSFPCHQKWLPGFSPPSPTSRQGARKRESDPSRAPPCPESTYSRLPAARRPVRLRALRTQTDPAPPGDGEAGSLGKR